MSPLHPLSSSFYPTQTDKEKKLMNACQKYEHYFFKKILKKMSSSQLEGKSHAYKAFHNMMCDTLGSGKTDLGIANFLFHRMRKNEHKE